MADRDVEPAAATAARRSELSRLFIVCGRDRTVDELRALFSSCGPIKHLHLALDRSKKSRGFAFLQFEDPANAAAAIEKLDHLTLDDGHVLKVTIAKERPAGGNGKLKRDQHARQDQDGKAEGGARGEDDAGLDARLPGKRQRSSPPVAALPVGTGRVTPASLLGKHQFGADAVAMGCLKTEPLVSRPLPTVDTSTDELMEADDEAKQVEHVMQAMLAAVESPTDRLFETYQLTMSTPGRATKPKQGAGLKVVVPGPVAESEEECSTDSLASSIRSVSLASTPMTMRGSPLDSLRTARSRTREGGSAPPPRSKHHLRRRRQSLDGSGSSAEDGADDSSIRRKRSNTTTSPPPTMKAHLPGNPQALSPPRTLSERSDISLSPDELKAEIIAKKLCKRHSSDNAIEASYRLAKQQATQERRGNDGAARQVESDYGRGRDVKREFKAERGEPAQAKLFFTSTYKFTEQELEAMFAVYGDLEAAELVKSFGRVKTMAYIYYSKYSTAAFVVNSFREESSQGEDDPERPEFMTLSFAHETGGFHVRRRGKPAPFPADSAGSCSSGLHPRLAAVNTPASTALSASGKDRLWVLLLYDRFLATHMLSSVVSSLSGMEFMDIKVVKSTGEAQGVAFVKFDSEASATQAALQLHQMELPLGSGKFLQAIVILAPSLFTTTHGSSSIGGDEAMRLDRSADERVVTGSSEDVDLRAVEARFAHLMRSTDHPHAREEQYSPHYASMFSPRGALPSEPMYPPSHSAGFHTSMGLSTGMEYYPMQLVPYPPPPQQAFQPYASFGGPPTYQQHQGFGASAPGWMETSAYYPGQYPFPSFQGQDVAFPVADSGEGVASSNDVFATPPEPRSSRSSSEQMDVEDGNSSQPSSSIHVSTSEPLELVTLVNALQDCPGVVSFAKDSADLTRYLVEFAKDAQAFEAVRNLDGSLCGGQQLRVAKATSTRHRGGGGGGKPRSGSGRRKRQRVDPRSRK